MIANIIVIILATILDSGAQKFITNDWVIRDNCMYMGIFVVLFRKRGIIMPKYFDWIRGNIMSSC